METTVERLNQVIVTEIIKNGTPYLQFDFMGHLNQANALKTIDQWKKSLKAGTKTHVIYNCTSMTGFDTEARKAWQGAMSTLKNQIGNTWIISTNVFILGAAKTMGLLTGFTIRVAKSLNDIKD